MHYEVEINRVREVSLLGTVRADFWREKLAAEQLQPIVVGERVNLVVSATEAKFKGFRFRELSFSILVRDTQQARDGAFLIQAFNSRRCFALVERRFFHTPYAPARIELGTSSNIALKLAQKHVLFSAKMRFEASLIKTLHERLELPIFLPTRRNIAPRLFYAKIQGETGVYPFVESQDELAISSAPELPVFEWLLQSEFSGQEWRLRDNAIHGKSKTVRRA